MRRSVVEMARTMGRNTVSTDERRTQTAIASARVRVLQELLFRADPLRHGRWRTRTTIFVASHDEARFEENSLSG